MQPDSRFDALKDELDSYCERGVRLSLQGKPCSPYNIVKAYRVSEPEATYMRDYISDENGSVKAIDFQRVTSQK